MLKRNQLWSDAKATAKKTLQIFNAIMKQWGDKLDRWAATVQVINGKHWSDLFLSPFVPSQTNIVILIIPLLAVGLNGLTCL